MECLQCGYDFPMRRETWFDKEELEYPMTTEHYCSCTEECSEDKHECYVEESDGVK